MRRRSDLVEGVIESALEPSASPGSALELRNLKRALLKRLGRPDDARELAWAEFQAHPFRFTYEELMRYVPRQDRAQWFDRAMAAAEAGELGDLIELWLATREITRLVERVRNATDAQLQGLSRVTSPPSPPRSGWPDRTPMSRGSCTGRSGCASRREEPILRGRPLPLPRSQALLGEGGARPRVGGPGRAGAARPSSQGRVHAGLRAPGFRHGPAPRALPRPLQRARRRWSAG